MSTLSEVKLGLTQLESVAGIQWKDVRLAYDTDGNLIYKGANLTPGASEASPDWAVWAMTWTSGNLTRIRGPVVGAWANRASL